MGSWCCKLNQPPDTLVGSCATTPPYLHTSSFYRQRDAYATAGPGYTTENPLSQATTHTGYRQLAASTADAPAVYHHARDHHATTL